MAKTGDPVISFKMTPLADEKLEQLAKELSEPEHSWRKPMSRHQMARAIVLAVLGEPDFQPMLEKLNLKRSE